MTTTCEHPTHKTYERARLELVEAVDGASRLHADWGMGVEARAEAIVEVLTDGLAVLRARTRDVEAHLQTGECLALQEALRITVEDVETTELSQRRVTVVVPDRRRRRLDRRQNATDTRVVRGRRKGD